MPENMMKLHLPVLPDPAFFKDPEHTILTKDGSALLTYDPKTRAAFVYELAQQRWNIMAPVAFDVFASWVALSGYQVNDTEDARRWVAACMEGSEKVGLH